MNIKQLVETLESKLDYSLSVSLPSGRLIPAHFHITEVGRVQKTFIDCGGTKRELVYCLLQAWTANDFDHRLQAGKLAKILRLASSILGSDDLPVELEYGADIASQYTVSDLVVNEDSFCFSLSGKLTNCLAPDKCGIKGCC